MTTFSRTFTFAALAASLLLSSNAMARDIRPMVPVPPEYDQPPGGDGEIEQPGNPTLEQVLVDEARKQLQKLDHYLGDRYGR